MWKEPAAASLVALLRYLERLTKIARKPNNVGLLPRFERWISQIRRGRVSGLCTHILTRVIECGRVRVCKCVCESLWACVSAWSSVCNRACERECVSVSEKCVWVCVCVCETVLYRRWPTVTTRTVNRLAQFLRPELPSRLSGLSANRVGRTATSLELLLLLEILTSQLSAGKHSPILGFNTQQE